MRLIERDDCHFDQISEVNKLSFNHDELAPPGILRERFDKSEVFVIERAGRVVSFALLDDKHGEKYVWVIATHPMFRGQGFAGELLTEIETWCREKNERGITLTCHRDNPAQKLYFDKGYRTIKVLQDYYLSGDGLFMRRKLL